MSNAHTASLAKDLHLVGSQFNQALIYYQIPFIIFGRPVTMLTKQCGAGYTLPTMLLIFGAASLASDFVTSFKQLVACRVIIGSAEAGFLPS